MRLILMLLTALTVLISLEGYYNDYPEFQSEYYAVTIENSRSEIDYHMRRIDIIDKYEKHGRFSDQQLYDIHILREGERWELRQLGIGVVMRKNQRY